MALNWPCNLRATSWFILIASRLNNDNWLPYFDYLGYSGQEKGVCSSYTQTDVENGEDDHQTVGDNSLDVGLIDSGPEFAFSTRSAAHCAATGSKSITDRPRRADVQLYR